MLEILEYLEKKISEIPVSDDETGDYLEYTLISDNSVNVNYGWTSYEEGDSNDLIIEITESKIKVVFSNSGHCVMGGDYDTTEEHIFDNKTQLFDWLNDNL